MVRSMSLSLMVLLSVCINRGLCFFSVGCGGQRFSPAASHPVAASREFHGPMLGGFSHLCTRILSPSKHQTKVAQWSSQDYILDSFDPDEDDDELSNENMLRIIYSEVPDQDVNFLVWKCLGYEKHAASGEWRNDNVFPKWKAKYPNPPDLIGVKRNYTYEIDRPVQRANQAIVASIPMKYKQGVKEQLRPLGFTGFKLDELTPNKTRRAQCVNWMLFYREALRGKSIEQLKAEREAGEQEDEFPKVVGADSLQRRDDDGGTMKEQSNWKYPNKPVL